MPKKKLAITCFIENQQEEDQIRSLLAQCDEALEARLNRSVFRTELMQVALNYTLRIDQMQPLINSIRMQLKQDNEPIPDTQVIEIALKLCLKMPELVVGAVERIISEPNELP